VETHFDTTPSSILCQNERIHNLRPPLARPRRVWFLYFIHRLDSALPRQPLREAETFLITLSRPRPDLLDSIGKCISQCFCIYEKLTASSTVLRCKVQEMRDECIDIGCSLHQISNNVNRLKNVPDTPTNLPMSLVTDRRRYSSSSTVPFFPVFLSAFLRARELFFVDVLDAVVGAAVYRVYVVPGWDTSVITSTPASDGLSSP
jgi:hypothetical protein